jgi:LysM repeat protein
MTTCARIRLLAALAGVLVPAAVQAQGTQPDSHTVRPGDTLWDLARQYLGDPFLWPEIYRINTSVVEDPHWIYPGEVLRLTAAPGVSAVPPTETPAPAAADTTAVAAAPDTTEAAPADTGVAAEAEPLPEPEVGDLAEDTGDSRDSVDLTPLVGDRRRVVSSGPSLELALRKAFRPVRRSEFFSSGFLTEGKALPLGDLIGTVTPLQIDATSPQTTAQLYTKVAVTPPPGARYQVGDSLLVLWVGREVEGYGRVVVPTGLLRVLDVSRPQVVAEVIAEYGQIVNTGQQVMPVEKFVDPGNVRPVPISDGVRAQLLAHRDRQPLSGPQDVIFLDKGREDGVALGDLFELRRVPRARRNEADVIDEPMATVQVVHIGDHTSTARVVSVAQPDITEGTPARQIAKLPS